MKKAFRKMSVVLAAVMAVAATSMLPVCAATNNNCTDTYWTVNNTAFTEYREKRDSSSAYIKNSTGNGITVSIYGASGANTRTYSVSECIGFENEYITTNLYMPGNCERLIKQYVKEKNYSHAMIYIYGNSNGAWSPDSIGTYEFLNGTPVA